MPNKQDTDQVRELVEHLNKLRTAAETLEHSKKTLDQALSERATILDGLMEASSNHSSRLDHAEQMLTDIQATVSKLLPTVDLGDFPASVTQLHDNLAAQQKLIEDTNRRIELLAKQNASMATALQPIEAQQHSLQLNFKSLYNELILVKEQIQKEVLAKPSTLPLSPAIRAIEPDSDHILKKIEGYKAQVNWLIIIMVLQFVVLGGAIMAILTARIF